MKTININARTGGINAFLFPDNQPHINLSIEDKEPVKVICSLTSSNTLMELLEVSNALDNLFALKQELHIPYLMAARFDRIMQKGDSFDLKVVAGLINSCKFEKVYLYDVHSDVSLALINNVVHITNEELVMAYEESNAILICPDAGASKKISGYLSINSNLTNVVYCNKKRDPRDGSLTLSVLEPEKCNDRNCVIIDDLCDGGGTFLTIADQIRPKTLTLIVTHGIFSKGMSKLEEKFQQIIVSNSYCQSYNSKIVKTVNIVK